MAFSIPGSGTDGRIRFGPNKPVTLNVQSSLARPESGAKLLGAVSGCIATPLTLTRSLAAPGTPPSSPTTWPDNVQPADVISETLSMSTPLTTTGTTALSATGPAGVLPGVVPLMLNLYSPGGTFFSVKVPSGATPAPLVENIIMLLGPRNSCPSETFRPANGWRCESSAVPDTLAARPGISVRSMLATS